MGFRGDFAWGTATAAFQIEGAVDEDGRGLSVWDVFSHEPGRVYDGHHADTACGHYHRLEEDVALLKGLGVNAYRFSVSWTRILPDGVGTVNEKGIEFYNRLIDLLLENGITPYMTLFHWDYPYELEKKGGWRNGDSPLWFAQYAAVAAKAFGDRVKNIFTFNEPQVFIGAYRSGQLAPGVKMADRDVVLMAHHVLLAHGLGVQEIRKYAPAALVSWAPTCGGTIPDTLCEADISAAKDAYFDVLPERWTWSVTWWSDPVLLGRYPEETNAFASLKKYLPDTYRSDLTVACQPLDFYGQNIYNGVRCRAGRKGYERLNRAPGSPRNLLDWPVTPEVMYWAPKFLYERYGLPIMRTENGMSCHDWIALDGKVHDPNRIDYTHRHLLELRRAAEDGVDVRGYMHWSLIDNFEWKDGYKERLGLVYLENDTLKRIPKDSYYWYKSVIAANGGNL